MPSAAQVSRSRRKPFLIGTAIVVVVLLAALIGVLAMNRSNDDVSSPSERGLGLAASFRDSNVLLGTKFDQPGLGFRNPDGTVTGFDASVSAFVVNTIADRLGVAHPKITWKETPSAQRETVILNGEVDALAATYSITAYRIQKVAFAGPYLITHQALLVRKAGAIKAPQDLDHDLCTVDGTTPAQRLKSELLPGVHLQRYEGYSSCVDALRDGKVDAVTADEVILAGYANQWPGEFTLVPIYYPKNLCVNGYLKTAGEPFSTERYGIGMSKDFPKTLGQVNDTLRIMMKRPADGGPSPWELSLRHALGDTAVDAMISRANAPGSHYEFLPTPGDLSFLDSKPITCSTATE